MKVFYLFVFLLFVTPIFAQGDEKGQKNAVMGIKIRDVKDVILDLDSKLNDKEIPDRYKVDIRNIRNKICVSEGVCIVNVEENSLANTSGLNVLDVIVAIDNKKVNTISSFNKIMKQRIIKDSLMVTVNRNCIESIIYLVPSRHNEAIYNKKKRREEIEREEQKRRKEREIEEQRQKVEKEIEEQRQREERQREEKRKKEEREREEKIKKEENALKESIQREYDEFTGEALIVANIRGPLSFAKTISESGKIFVLLKWNSSSRKKPDSKNLRLIILFDDNSRLSVNLPIVYEYNEFLSSFTLKVAIETETVMDPTFYSLRSEVILNASQIAALKSKSIKKYRLEGYSADEIYEEDVDSKIIFNELLNIK